MKRIVVLAPKVEKQQILMACCPATNKAKSV
jgi:hypothetical protein